MTNADAAVAGDEKVVRLSDRLAALSVHAGGEPPVWYDIAVCHHWDSTVETWVKGIETDGARPAIAEALRCAADGLDPPWKPVEALTPDDGQILACTEDGRRMIWDAKILLAALKNPPPRHMQFPTTWWTRLPAVPETTS